MADPESCVSRCALQERVHAVQALINGTKVSLREARIQVNSHGTSFSWNLNLWKILINFISFLAVRMGRGKGRFRQLPFFHSPQLSLSYHSQPPSALPGGKAAKFDLTITQAETLSSLQPLQNYWTGAHSQAPAQHSVSKPLALDTLGLALCLLLRIGF